MAELQEQGAYILDVRTAAENRMGRIEGSVNIPLDDLRGRLSELPKDQPIYVHCAIGLRGYLACRILSQNGFDCLNLSGDILSIINCTEKKSRGVKRWKRLM